MVVFGVDLCFTAVKKIFLPRDFRAPFSDHRKIFARKILWARKMQNLAQFWITSNFDGKYLWNG